MKYLVLLSLAAFSQCAPVMEQGADSSFEAVGDVQDEAERIKRAQEVIMFGNEQNVQKVVKKSDPNIDLNGHIEALEPIDIPVEQSSAESAEQSNSEANVDETKATEVDNTAQSVDSDETVDDLAEQLLKEEPEIEESLKSADVILPELDESAPASSEEDGAEAAETDGVSVENGDESALQDPNVEVNDEALQEYLDELYRQQLGQELQEYYNRNSNYFRPGYRRRRSYRARRKAMSRRPFVNEDKRNHRTKRDLIYPGLEDDEQLGDYLVPYGDQYLEDGYLDEDPETETEYLQEYLEFLDNQRVQEEAEKLRAAYSAELEPLTYQGEQGYFVPKRQAGLNFVPGIKRDDIFYPAFEEPGTHWGAFVPSKRNYREYADKYERLMQLAAILSGREDVNDAYDEREYDWVRK